MFPINRSWLIAMALGVLLLLAGCGNASRKVQVKTTPPPVQQQAPNTADHTPAASTTTQPQAPSPAEHGPSANRTAPLPPPGH